MRIALQITLLLVAVAGLGCHEEVIRTQRVPKPPPATERTLAVLIPRADATWFLKLTGPSVAVTADESALRTFAESMTFAADNQTKWTVPSTWREEPEAKSRFAAWRTPNGLVASVTKLGPEAANVLDNVNRWRRQIGLGPVDDADLPRMTKAITVGDTAAMWVDIETRSLPAMKLLPAPTTAPNVGSSKPSANEQVTHQAPASWTVQAPKPPRVVSFRIGAGEHSAEAFVTQLGGMAGGTVANVNRWRGEIGLPEQPANEVTAALKEIEVAGQKCPYCDLLGKEGPKRERTLGVIVVRGDTSWFVKMRGAADVVAEQQAAFESFVRSLAFTGGG